MVARSDWNRSVARMSHLMPTGTRLRQRLSTFEAFYSRAARDSHTKQRPPVCLSSYLCHSWCRHSQSQLPILSVVHWRKRTVFGQFWGLWCNQRWTRRKDWDGKLVTAASMCASRLVRISTQDVYTIAGFFALRRLIVYVLTKCYVG